ncbi:MAG TPA: PPOX class F420-dependent oxidoreductase, partial [Thermomicrobiales bacterium]|nr:PPOX class F420-dependent oxidoreductase [Thermomicrobiales bacterium]
MSVADTIPADYADLLERPTFAHVATVGPNGEPQNNPVWFDWDGERIFFSQTTGRQKVRNIQSEPRVALSIIDPDNPYRYLEIRGVVERIEPDPDKAFIDKMAKKYLGAEKYP